MIISYQGLQEISGSLIALEGVTGVGYEEQAEIRMRDGSVRTGKIARIDGDRVIVQVFEGTSGFSLENTETHSICLLASSTAF